MSKQDCILGIDLEPIATSHSQISEVRQEEGVSPGGLSSSVAEQERPGQPPAGARRSVHLGSMVSLLGRPSCPTRQAALSVEAIRRGQTTESS